MRSDALALTCGARSALSGAAPHSVGVTLLVVIDCLAQGRGAVYASFDDAFGTQCVPRDSLSQLQLALGFNVHV